MIRSRLFAIELAAQVVLALAIGLFVSIVLAGVALLLAGNANVSYAAPPSAASEQAART